jgi:hypothetical protein
MPLQLFDAEGFFNFVEARRKRAVEENREAIEAATDPHTLVMYVQALQMAAIAEGVAENNRRIMEMLGK